jgi:WD40 repeat protein
MQGGGGGFGPPPGGIQGGGGGFAPKPPTGGFPGGTGGSKPKDSTTGIAVISPDGRRVAVAPNNAAILVFDAETGKQIFRSVGHTEPLSGLAFSPDGKTLASGSKDKSVILWDAATGKQLRQINVKNPVVTIRFNNNGRTILIFDSSMVVEIDVQSGATVRP